MMMIIIIIIIIALLTAPTVGVVSSTMHDGIVDNAGC